MECVHSYTDLFCSKSFLNLELGLNLFNFFLELSEKNIIFKHAPLEIAGCQSGIELNDFLNKTSVLKCLMSFFTYIISC